MIIKNKKLLLTVFLTYFFIKVNILFAVPYDMISTGDPVLEDLRFLSLETGRPLLSFSPPFAPDEVRNFIYSIDESELSQPAREAYYRVLERLSPRANISFNEKYLSVFANVNVTIEGGFRFNPDISLHPKYPKIDSLISLPIQAFFADSIQLYIEPSYTMRPEKYGLPLFDSTTFYTNIPFDYREYNESMPLRAFLAVGGKFWNFQIGRDRLYFGTGKTGSLTLSNNSEYFDFARLSFFSQSVKYSVIVNQMPLALNERLFTTPITEWEEHRPDLTRTMHRYFYLRRLDFTLFRRVSLTLIEGIIIGNSQLELRYLNPLMVYHNFFPWREYDVWRPSIDGTYVAQGIMTGSVFSVEVNWNIIKSLSVYGQFALHEWATKDELRNQPNQPPNSLGYLAGIQYTHSLKTWGSSSYLEFIYTDPYFNILSSPFASFIQLDRSTYYYIGYPRDTIAVTAGTEFFNMNKTLSFSGYLSWVSKGEHKKYGLIWNWEKTPEARNERTPSGSITENKFILSLGSQWKPAAWLTLKGNLTGIVSLNNNHISGNNETGGQISLSASFHY